jgi:hypothetical protein
MVKQIVTHIPQDQSEVDQLIMDWLVTHHILAKDVRAYVISRRVGDVEIMTLEVITSGVDEIEPAPLVDTEDTLRKVRQALTSVGLNATGSMDAINAMQNLGILFRERAGLNHPGSDRWTGGDRKDEA